MHILHLSLDYPSGTGGSGVGTQVHTLAHALIASGHQVTVLALAEQGQPDQQDDRGIEIRRIQPGSIHWYASKIPWLGSRIAKPLRELEYCWISWRETQRVHAEHPVDVIEGTETGMLFVALFLKKIPLVIRLHGEEYTFALHTPGRHIGASLLLSRMMQRAALIRARILVSPSIAHAREIRRELGRRTPPTEVIPNNIPLLATHGHPPFSNKPGSLAVLYVGRLELRKGISVLLEAAIRINEQVPGTRFLLAGKRHASLPQADLDRMIEQSGLDGQIELLGHVTREDLPAWYDVAQVCVCPSFYETFGLSALEGMAAGVPVVVTNAGAFPEVVGDSDCGVLVNPGDSEALAAAVVRLLRDPALRTRMGAAGREHARRSFEVQHQLEDNVRLYVRAAGLEKPPADLTEGEEHIFFSPHPDDAVISCGGLIELLRDKGAKVTVITLFTRVPEAGSLSAFARHLHSKWKLTGDVQAQRRAEDQESLAALDVSAAEHWDFSDAPYRQDAAGQPLYTSYEQLRGAIQSADTALEANLYERIAALVRDKAASAIFYFPCAIGGHVDHRLVNGIGRLLCDDNATIRFYEDWPYVQKFTAEPAADWTRRALEVPLEKKIRATACHRSQFREPAATLKSRFRSFECYWEPKPRSDTGAAVRGPIPYSPAEPATRLRDMRTIAGAFRFHDLDEILPEGNGICLDLGAGSGRHRSVAEARGYRWFGIDRGRGGNRFSAIIRGDIAQAPFASASAACVIAWQVLEYLEQPEHLFAEAARLLSPGGVFCGSASFLEPVHGQTYYNLSPLIIRRLLRKHGFSDISIKPGVGALPLQAWTWLRRTGGPRAARIAMPLTAVLIVPVLSLRFAVSWLMAKTGLGSGFSMRRTLETEPLEFAGHVLFSARKTGICT